MHYEKDILVFAALGIYAMLLRKTYQIVPIVFLFASSTLLAIKVANAQVGQLDKCATENQVCEFEGHQLVTYGVADKTVSLFLKSPVQCNNGTFGDPAPNIVKACYLGKEAPIRTLIEGKISSTPAVNRIIIMGRPVGKMDPGYNALSAEYAAPNDPPRNNPANLTTGIGGKDIRVYYARQNFEPSSSQNTTGLITDINVGDWGGSWNFPPQLQQHNFKPVASFGGGIPPGALSPGTDGSCDRIGFSFLPATPANTKTDETIVTEIGLSVTENSSPAFPDWSEWKITPDIHSGCGDDYAYNIYYRKLSIDNPAPNIENSREISSKEKISIMNSYLPKAYIWMDAQFRPSTVDYFLNNTKPENISGQIWQVTRQNLPSPSDVLPFFRGQAVDQAPVYAFWVDKIFGPEIVYFYFYPYNRGKEKVDTIWGNHVGDWEHMSVRFSWAQTPSGWGLKPQEVYYSTHDKGFTKSWADAPREGSHPIGFVARGSHAMYPFSGSYTYKNIPILGELVDHMPTIASGQALFNPELLQTYDHTGADLSTGFKPNWMSIFRWGNPKQACLVVGPCRLEDGPTGPLVKSYMAASSVARFEGR